MIQSLCHRSTIPSANEWSSLLMEQSEFSRRYIVLRSKTMKMMK
jgi:hypothetical protein